MRGKALLLGSVSSLATIAVAVSAAHAQSVNPGANGYTFSVQGGGLFSAPTNTTLSDKAGEKGGSGLYVGSGFTGITSLKDLPTDIGYNAAFTFGKKLDGNWDLAFGASMNRLLENSGTVSFTGTSGSGASLSTVFEATTVNTNLGFETGDFEVGYTPVLDTGLQVRLFGGIRALHFNSATDKAGSLLETGNSSGFASFDTPLQSDFLGVGPRIGVSAAKRFDGSNFGLSGSIAAAAIFGRQTDTGTINFQSTGTGGPFGGALGTINGQATKMVTDLEASLGIDYYLSDASALTVGYHAEELFNIGNVSDTIVFGTTSSGNNAADTNKLVSGPFVKFTGSF